jgi:hypothetical protein
VTDRFKLSLPREGWEEAFKQLGAEGGGALLDDYLATSFEHDDWEWPRTLAAPPSGCRFTVTTCAYADC